MLQTEILQFSYFCIEFRKSSVIHGSRSFFENQCVSFFGKHSRAGGAHLARAGRPGEPASQSASVASQAQPAKRERWVASHSALHQARLPARQASGQPDSWPTLAKLVDFSTKSGGRGLPRAPYGSPQDFVVPSPIDFL